MDRFKSMSHKKPTKEELKAELDKIEKEIEEPTPSTPPAPEPEPTPEPEPVKEDPTPEPEPTPSIPPPSEEDEEKKRLKEQYKGSTREALVQKAAREALAKAIKEAENVDMPTDDEMAAEYDDWDILSEGEKKARIKVVLNDKRFALINKANKEAEDFDGWVKKVEDFAENPETLATYSELEGKTEQFKAFAITKTRRGVPLPDLLKAFLFDATKEAPKKKGSMFEKPGGGDGKKGESKPEKISMADADKIRINDYAEYKRLLRAGRIDMDSIS